MKVLYKTVMFLTLLILCIGSVCATDPDNNTNVNSNLTDDQKVINEVNNIVNTALEKKNAEIKALQDNDIKQSNEIQQLKDNNTQLDKRVKDLEYSKLTQSNRIKSLEIDIKNLEDSNKQLINSNKQLIDSNKDLNVKIDNQSVTINGLKTDNEALNVKIDNQNSIINELNTTVNNQRVIINELNTTVNNQNITINELNNKLDLKSIEINTLQADKDKLNAEVNRLKDEKCSIYEKLLSSPKKEDYEQLKKDITNKDNKIKELTVKINKLNSLLSVSGNDIVNSLKHLSSIKNIKCGKYTFSLDEYLKIPLIKYGKDRVLKYKKSHGRLPNYVTIAGYDVPKKVYQKLYNL